MSRGKTLAGLLMLVGIGVWLAPGLRSAAGKAQARPEVWKAINYAPRGHPYFRMLYDWFDQDQASGRSVKELAAADLALLHRSGFNAVHLYLWDRPTFEKFQRSGGTRLLEPAGFSFPDPRVSPHRQWEALDEFIGFAAKQDIWVIPHFVHTTFNDGDLDSLSRAEVETRAEEIVNLAGVFVEALSPKHRNILAWGALYALEPAPDDDPAQPSNYSLLWRKVYVGLKKRVERASPAGDPPPLFTFLFFPSSKGGMQPPKAESVDPGPLLGYKLDAGIAKRRWASMKRHLSYEMGRSTEPDLLYVYLFGPDPVALGNSVRELTVGSGAVPIDRLFVAEYGVSSPFGASRNPRLAFGENGAPTTDLDGQASWLRQSLCEFDRAGLRKTAYWTLYDAAALWSSDTWSWSADEVSLNGHWGLAFEDAAQGFKPGWQVLSSHHQGAAVGCGAAALGPVVDSAGKPVRWVARQPDPPRASPDRSDADDNGLAIRAAVSSASFKAGRWYPGSLMSLFVSGLRDVPPLWVASTFPLPRTQFGIRVEYRNAMNEVWSAPILGLTNSGADQVINVQVPWEVLNATEVRVSQNELSASAPGQRAEYWGDFFIDDDGGAVAIHADTGERVTKGNPARSSEVVTLYLTNLPTPPAVPATGEVGPAVVDTTHSLQLNNGKSGYVFAAEGESFGDTSRYVLYVGLAPSSVGLFQMKILAPPVKEPRDIRIYYLECLNNHGRFLPCLAGSTRSETRLPVAPAP